MMGTQIFKLKERISYSKN